MSETLKDFLNSGRKLITDTKIKYIKNNSKEAKVLKEKPIEAPDDPHKTFVRRTILEKPKKQDIVEEFKKFIKSAEEHL
jgi:hypothetical protein